MHHLQRSGKMLGETSSSCQSFFLCSKATKVAAKLEEKDCRHNRVDYAALE